MRKIVLISQLVLMSFVKAQVSSSIELSYDYIASKVTHYNLSRPGTITRKLRQPYNYIGTISYNLRVKKTISTVGLRGYWINGNEKSIGGQLGFFQVQKSR